VISSIIASDNFERSSFCFALTSGQPGRLAKAFFFALTSGQLENDEWATQPLLLTNNGERAADKKQILWHTDAA